MIPHLEDLSLFERIVLTIVIAAVALLLIWVVESVSEEQLYQGVPVNEHLLRLDKLALDKAYEQHVLLLFSVWLKDDISVVHRINNGLRRGREAYLQAAARIEERERTFNRPQGVPPAK